MENRPNCYTGPIPFYGPANGYTCVLHIHSAITRLGWLVCFSRPSFTNPANSWLKTMGPMGGATWKAWVWNSPQWWGDVSYAIQTCLDLWLALLGLIASPNSPNGVFNQRLASHPPTPYNVPSMILQWFWKKLLKIQQCKLANRISYIIQYVLQFV